MILRNRKIPVALVLLLAVLMVVNGCGQIIPKKKCHPNKTATSESSVQNNLETTIKERGWEAKTEYYENIGVRHRPVYLKGYYEKNGSNDGEFRTWHYDDAISLVASPGVFLKNVLFMPVSMANSPPWQGQESRSVYPYNPEAFDTFASEPATSAKKN